MSPAHLARYVQYIRNTGRVPLASEMFDEDWEPIGPSIRADMARHGLIEESNNDILLTTAGEALL